MSEHRRTAIRKLSVRRYRSLSEVVLDDLPEIIVLYGPNGAGKSNILRAAQLVLRAASLPDPLPTKREEAVPMTLSDADKMLDLRPDDFRFGCLPEIRVSLEIELGPRALDILALPSGRALSTLKLTGVFQLDGDSSVRFWFERAHVSGGIVTPGGVRRRSVNQRLRPLQRTRIPDLLQLSGAYRVPGGAEDPQSALYQAFLSENPRERDAARRLSQRLATAGLFGAPAEGIALVPVDSRTYGEKQIRLKHPTHGELPLRNLGSGEQQLVLMLGQRVITPYPIAHVEEPEAHLHKNLMEPLARVLRDSVLGNGGAPDVDQLWMATHHDDFAIAPELFDVALDAKGATQIKRRKRDEVAERDMKSLRVLA